MKGITVLKVGGSLAESGAAARLMRELGARRPKRLLIVPGGGTFADAVRAAQGRQDLSERAAHHMALLAMHLYGVMLADFAAGFVLAERPEQFEAAWRDGDIPVWLPAPMVLAADLPACWDITSDSLAAWLADEIQATRLVLVKSCPLPEDQHGDARALAAAGIVDRGLPAFVEGRPFRWVVISGVEATLSALC